jgi:hypothetical protein
LLHLFQNGHSILYSNMTIVWLVVWNRILFSIYWEFHHPNWLIFFRGGGQPPTSSIYIIYILYNGDIHGNTFINHLAIGIRYYNHRIGWWENLQESPIFDGKNHGFL